MRKAEDYPNTVEFAAEKLYIEFMQDIAKSLDMPGDCGEFKNLNDCDTEFYRSKVITFLDSKNYFENKTCKDCGYFDSEDNTCFGQDVEYPENGDSPICRTFAPCCLVEVKA